MVAAARAALAEARALHAPVLLDEVIDALSPSRGGVFLDATFGAGGYTTALLDKGADRVIAVDRDPEAIARGLTWAAAFEGRLEVVQGRFGDLEELVETPLSGVVFDIGVSSMQIDQAGRGFSFQKDGPLDMRMSQSGPSAADIVNSASQAQLADIFFIYGEERASRRIARAIVAARPIDTTLQLAEVIAAHLPRQKPGQSHPATRSFQALRIAVNEEYDELYQGLMAAERALRPGGLLAVVSFHSVEDRMVKRFMQIKSGGGGGGSRYAPQEEKPDPAFSAVTRKPIAADADEVAANPRARSALLRVARRTETPASEIDPGQLGMPLLKR